MSEAKHTTGPWEIGMYEWLIEAGDDTEVAQAHAACPNFRANARLIAAAPLGYELAKTIAEWPDLPRVPTHILAMALEFLAKAEGRTP